jgi:hypothetical protein
VLALVLAVFSGIGRVDAQQWTCYRIRSGDTAAQLAARLTGAAQSRYLPWFQIADPATSRFIAKTQYDRIQAGWLACILSQAAGAAAGSAPDASAPPLNSRSRLFLPDFASTAADVRIDPVSGVALLIGALLWLWHAANQYWKNRQATVAVMTHFGHAFLREFERPLIQPGCRERPLRCRIRVNAGRACVDLFLAPGTGRCYPNLVDHRRNVEYDIARVLHAIGRPPFVSGLLQQRGPWVVIPFQLNVPQQEAGGT